MILVLLPPSLKSSSAASTIRTRCVQASAMSLYGGINFKGQAKAPATPAAAAAAAPSESVSASASPAAETNNSNSGTESPAGQQVHAANEDKPKRTSLCAQLTPAPVSSLTSPIRAAATWSAALRFAPTVRKKPNSQGAAANARGSASAFALKSAFGAAADDDDGGNDGSPAARGSGAGAGMPAGYRMATVGKAALTAMPEKAPPVNKWSAVSRPVEEIKPFAGSSKANSASNMQRASPVTADSATSDPSAGRARARPRRIIANPPAMTLDDAPLAAATTPGTDVNGFEQSAAGKKLAAQQNKKRGGKKKRGGAGGAGPHEDPALAFADVPYDPTRPCDYVRVPCAGHASRTRSLSARRWRCRLSLSASRDLWPSRQLSSPHLRFGSDLASFVRSASVGLQDSPPPRA